MPRLRAVSTWALLILGAGACAQATTINFTASVTSTNINSFSNGQIVTGSLIFDSGVSGLPQFDGSRIYTGAITSFQFAGLTPLGTQNQNVISVLPFSVSGFNEVFDARVGSANSTLEFYLEAEKNTGALGNGALPSAALNSAAFQDPSAFFSTYVQFSDFSNGYQYLNANLTPTVPNPVPEPASLALLLTGAVGLFAGLRHRGRYTSSTRKSCE